VTAAQVDAYLERCRIAPDSYSREPVPYKGHSSPQKCTIWTCWRRSPSACRGVVLASPGRSGSTLRPWSAGGRPDPQQPPAGLKGAAESPLTTGPGTVWILPRALPFRYCTSLTIEVKCEAEQWLGPTGWWAQLTTEG
jgi:hypothetical protein